MADATSISSLPGEMDTSKSNRVVLETREIDPAPANTVMSASMQQQQHPPIAPSALSQDSINQIVQGISAAAGANMTELPSRDIPLQTTQFTQDSQIQPNYIPKGEGKDYIGEHDTYQAMLEQKQSSKVEQDKLDVLYSELQLPMLVMVLFFLFQMPFFQKKLMSFVPSLFAKDGTPNLSGFMFKTALFGVAFYFIIKSTKYISEV